MVYRLLQRQTRRWHGKATVVSAERSLTYRELLRAVDQAVVYFQSPGLRTGDSIILGLPPCPEFYIIFFAACALGLKVMPVLPSGKIPRVIVDGKPEVAVGDAGFLAEARRQCGGLKDCIAWNRIEGLKIPPTKAEFAHSELFHEQPVIGVSSSGSTGVPSIYFRSAELLVRRAQFRARSLGITENDILLSARFFDMGEPPGPSNELVLLGEDGVFDSVTALELVLALEQAFGIVIQDEEIRPEHLKSIESIAAFVEATLARQSQGAS